MGTERDGCGLEEVGGDWGEVGGDLYHNAKLSPGKGVGSWTNYLDVVYLNYFLLTFVAGNCCFSVVKLIHWLNTVKMKHQQRCEPSAVRKRHMALWDFKNRINSTAGRKSSV